MYGFCLWLGVRITGGDLTSPSIAWNELTLKNAYGILEPYLWPFVAGTLVVGLIAAIAAYFGIYWAVIRYRKKEIQLSKSLE
jgi:uncharacterized protein (DUF2062 family)